MGLRERLRRAWIVFRAYSANEEPPAENTRHEWVCETEAMEYFDEATAIYSDKLYSTAAKVARNDGSFDRHGNPLITVEVAAKAHKMLTTCVHDQAKEFLNNTTDEY